MKTQHLANECLFSPSKPFKLSCQVPVFSNEPLHINVTSHTELHYDNFNHAHVPQVIREGNQASYEESEEQRDKKKCVVQTRTNQHSPFIPSPCPQPTWCIYNWTLSTIHSTTWSYEFKFMSFRQSAWTLSCLAFIIQQGHKRARPHGNWGPTDNMAQSRIQQPCQASWSVHITNPVIAPKKVWERFQECYAAPKIIEKALFNSLDRLANGTTVCQRELLSPSSFPPGHSMWPWIYHSKAAILA